MEEEGSGETKSSLVLCICPKPESGVIPAILMRGGGAVLRKTYVRSLGHTLPVAEKKLKETRKQSST